MRHRSLKTLIQWFSSEDRVSVAMYLLRGTSREALISSRGEALNCWS